METFGEWLLAQLEERGWSQSELARRSQLGTSTLSRIISGERNAGADAAVAIARALGESPERVLRLANLLPSLPPAVEEEREVVSILRRLPEAVRRTVVTMLRALVGQQASVPAVGEYKENYITADVLIDNTLIPELIEEFAKVPDEWKEEALRQIQFLNRVANLPPRRLIGEDDVVEEQRTEPGA